MYELVVLCTLSNRISGFSLIDSKFKVPTELENILNLPNDIVKY